MKTSGAMPFCFVHKRTHIKPYQVPDTKPTKFLEESIIICIFITLTSYSSDSLILPNVKFVLKGFITLAPYNIAIPKIGLYQAFIRCDEG